MRRWLFIACAAVLLLSCTSDGESLKRKKPPLTAHPEHPNIVFLLTDDVRPEDLHYMPAVKAQLVSQGTTFENFTYTTPLCCPSRASMLRGQYAHNHGIWFNRNGAENFAAANLDASTVATWIDGAGYKTGYVGKYLNSYNTLTVPPGWDQFYGWAGLDNVTKDVMNDNGQRRNYTGEPLDRVAAEKAIEFIKNSGERPFFLWVGFVAAHTSPVRYYPGQDADKFSDAPLPRSPNFNEADVSDKPEWVRSRPPLRSADLAVITGMHRDRLRRLQVVDRKAKQIVNVLRSQGELGDTYIFFLSDNGYHLGAHRLPYDKRTPYMEDLTVPMIVRGPGIEPGSSVGRLTANIDIAPTLADLAHTTTPSFVDGRSLVPLLDGSGASAVPPWREALLFEQRDMGDSGSPPFTGVLTSEYSYTVYETGERELYDLEADPYELQNLAGSDAVSGVEDGLSARLSELKGCAGDACRAAENAP
jgi:N-acetylglucosamine-6-sulfatase